MSIIVTRNVSAGVISVGMDIAPCMTIVLVVKVRRKLMMGWLFPDDDKRMLINLGVLIIVLMMVIFGGAFLIAWLVGTAPYTTHLGGQCREFYQYVVVGKQVVLVRVEVCP